MHRNFSRINIYIKYSTLRRQTRRGDVKYTLPNLGVKASWN